MVGNIALLRMEVCEGPLRWLPRTRILVFRRRIWRVSLVPLWIDRDRVPTPSRLVPAFSASISRGGAAIFSEALGGMDVTRDDVRTQAFTQFSVTASPRSSRAATQLPPPLTIATSEALREMRVFPRPNRAVEKLMPMGGSPLPHRAPPFDGSALEGAVGSPSTGPGLPLRTRLPLQEGRHRQWGTWGAPRARRVCTIPPAEGIIGTRHPLILFSHSRCETCSLPANSVGRGIGV
ncbi:hypothetical protein ACOMHN_048069 [Nucella lapillus]